jgi:hypothetical protein
MAVAVQLEFSGATLEQYDEVIKKMGHAWWPGRARWHLPLGNQNERRNPGYRRVGV